MVVGTVAYMSPEQAMGMELDARTDLFSFGVVLYQMATGRLPFTGSTSALIFNAILNQTPTAPVRLNPECPAELERIINKLIEKDRELRYQHASELHADLKRLKRDTDSGRGVAVGPVGKRARPYLWLSMTLVLGAILGAAAWLWLGRSRPLVEQSMLTPVPLTAYPGTETYPSFSPDGTQVAFQGCPDGWLPGKNCDIYVKQIGIEPASRLTDTRELEFCPAWSPNGAFIAFLRQISPEKVSLILIPQRGGTERLLAELDLVVPPWLGLYGPSIAWTPDSKWIAAPEEETGRRFWALYLISVETGEKRRLTTPSSMIGEEEGDTSPAFSPDGRILAFARLLLPISDLFLLRLGEGCNPHGEPEKVPVENPYKMSVAWTPDGREIVFSSGDALWRVAASGLTKPRRLPLVSENACVPAISRQGNRLAYAVKRSDTDIWRVDLRGPDRKPGVPFKLIFSTRADSSAAFSPDGKRIAFESERSGVGRIWLCDSDGSNLAPLTSSGDGGNRMKWSPDGQSIAFDVDKEGNGKEDIYVISANGGAPRRLTTDPAADNWPCWSQDGQSVYFTSTRSGAKQIWKMPAGGGDAVQITRDAGADIPRESPDGKFV
jgi:Tol biopolymer transport system component